MTEADAHSWQPVDLLALGTSEPVRPTIGSLIYPGKVHLFSGEPETLKTLSARALGAEAIRAGLGVLLVDFEIGDRDTLAGFRDLGLADDEIRDLLVYVAPTEPLTRPGPLADVAALLNARKPALVIVDSYTPALELHGCDSWKGPDIQRFSRTVVDPLRAQGAAVVLIDHLVKDRERRGKFSIGSERKVGVCDAHIGFDVVLPLSRGGSGLVRLDTHKDRGGFLPRPRAAEIAFASDSETGRLTWEIRPVAADGKPGEPFRPTTLMTKVSRHLELAGEPVSRRRVEAGVGGKRDWVRIAIDTLVREGYAEESAGSHGARLVSFAHPFDPSKGPPRPSSPHLAPSSPRAQTSSSPHLAPPPQGGERRRGADENGTAPQGEELTERLLRDHADIAELRT